MLNKEELTLVAKVGYVSIKSIGSAKTYYENLGYTTEAGKLSIKVCDLNKNSKIKIKAINGETYEFRKLLRLNYKDFKKYNPRDLGEIDLYLIKAKEYFKDAEIHYKKGLEQLQKIRKELDD